MEVEGQDGQGDLVETPAMIEERREWLEVAWVIWGLCLPRAG